MVRKKGEKGERGEKGGKARKGGGERLLRNWGSGPVGAFRISTKTCTRRAPYSKTRLD